MDPGSPIWLVMNPPDLPVSRLADWVSCNREMDGRQDQRNDYSRDRRHNHRPNQWSPILSRPLPVSSSPSQPDYPTAICSADTFSIIKATAYVRQGEEVQNTLRNSRVIRIRFVGDSEMNPKRTRDIRAIRTRGGRWKFLPLGFWSICLKCSRVTVIPSITMTRNFAERRPQHNQHNFRPSWTVRRSPSGHAERHHKTPLVWCLAFFKSNKRRFRPKQLGTFGKYLQN